MEEEKLLRQVYSKEKQLGLYNETLLGIPIWRILRHFTRLHYLNAEVGLSIGSSTARGEGKAKLKLFSGFWKYVGKGDLNVFFPFSRLSNIKGEYLDKFVDPIISQTEIERGNYVIIDPPNYIGDYKRIHKDHTITNEGRTVLRQLYKYWFKLVAPLYYGKKLSNIYYLGKNDFHLNESCLKRYNDSISTFLGTYYYYLLWFKILKPRRVFVVFREAYFPQIAVCKRLHIPVAEFQHGITIGDTKSFTGEYDSRIDPDYFLIFGEFWKGPQFGILIERMFCAGWAYKDLISWKLGKVVEKLENRVLVISSPPITDNIISSLEELSKAREDLAFDLRLHPSERFSPAQQERLGKIRNTQVVDNKIESAIALLTYKYVVGENSSVIYEALSVGCKVGMLNLSGLRPPIDRPGIKDNFFVINNREDFERFLTGDSNQSTSKAEFYSEFDSKRFMEFIENKM